MARSTSSGVAVTAASLEGAPAHSTVLNLLISIRPSQWTKNLLVFAGLLFGRRLFEPAALAAAASAFLVFCALAGAVYLINDVLDQATDRQNPLKAKRPIASGALSAPMALTAAIALTVLALIAAFALNPR